MNSLRTLKIARNGYIIIALVICALGIVLLTNQNFPIDILCEALGIIFVADGVIKIIGYFSKDFYCLAFQYDFAFGILMVAVGVLILIRGEGYLRLLYSVMGLIILTDALFRIQMSLDAKKFGLNLWWRILLIAILTGIFGMILLIDPYDGTGMTVTLTGVTVFLYGVLNLCVAVYTIKILEQFSDQQDRSMIDSD
ncbi:MAG: DUF308 domain-containing protein [Lachnospiraceae bacterium]|nr:DUF308 domain-containing protein [Lachnospiraceae bacterium]